MRVFLYPILWAVSAAIFALMAAGFGLEWIGVRLVPLQKLLIKKIEGRQ